MGTEWNLITISKVTDNNNKHAITLTDELTQQFEF